MSPWIGPGLNRNLDHQIVEGDGREPRQHRHLRARLDLKDAGGVGLADHGVGGRVLGRDGGKIEPSALAPICSGRSQSSLPPPSSSSSRRRERALRARYARREDRPDAEATTGRMGYFPCASSRCNANALCMVIGRRLDRRGFSALGEGDVQAYFHVPTWE